MELFRTDDFYIFVKDEMSLWWDRQTGTFIPKKTWTPDDADNPVCLGICEGIIGKVEHPSVFDTRLLLIKESVSIGKLHGNNEVYKIKSIEFLKLGNENVNVNLHHCRMHKTHLSSKSSSANPLLDIQKNIAFSKTLGSLKNAGSVIKNTTQQALAAGVSLKRDSKDKEKFERQIIEEFHKIFTDTNSFFFSHTCDVTSSLQRLCNLEKKGKLNVNALWKTVDDRFFWNKHMLKSLIELNNPLCDPWILPIIQGYVQIEDCKVKLDHDVREKGSAKYEIFKLCILSRRSRFRAGTRYKRRGVDENGECANYVETEQIIQYHNHEVSFVQVRGSVPVYWSQPGYKYRPPPRIDKGEDETKDAFAKHFNSEMKRYGPICIINLIDQSGKEKIIWDAYSHHIFQYNCPYLTYVTFDFHEYCRGMRFENVSILINSIADVIKNMNYCWRDRQGHICSQVGVFRVNCIDCLDRTNVVQTAVGKAVMEIQFCKLGLITPDGIIPNNIKRTFQLLWANNGDIISKQYAGTNALKGDYTRTGERKFSGIMKDGMNSANRYYLSRFKDATRQGTIDLMLGNYVSEEEFFFSKMQQFEEDSMATAEHVKLVIEDCKKMLINDPQLVLGSWGLINADPSMGDPNETEMDTILILTKDSYYVADYDDQVDKVTNYQRVALSDVTLLESGTPETAMSLFKSNKSHYSMRINYQVNEVSGYYHMFRSTNLRFFNNMAVVIKNEEEILESLKSICEAFIVAFEVSNLPPVPYHQGHKLDKRKSKVLSDDSRNQHFYLDVGGFPHLTRNVSESQLAALKHVGSKALTNMSQQFSKLNKLGSSFKQTKSSQAKFSVGKSKQNETSSESEEEYENSIFQPNASVESGTAVQYHSDSDSDLFIEQGVEITEETKILETKSSETKIPETFLASVGIVMGAPSETQKRTESGSVLENKENMSCSENSSHVNDLQLLSIMRNVSIQNADAPEIQINSEECDVSDAKKPPSSLKLDRKLSHSAGEVDANSEHKSNAEIEPDMIHIASDCRFEKRSNSEQDVTLNISQSQSESALKNKLTNLTSPVASVTRDLVLTPFSKIAKGMQNLGANLDPRKMAVGGLRHGSEREYEEHRKFQEKWKHCKTRLIAL